MSDEKLIFFDVGGNAYGAQSEPVTEGLDSNKFLCDTLGNYKQFLKDRIVIQELISRLSSTLYTAGWFIPLQYRLVYPDNEAEMFIGSFPQRYNYANEVNTDFGIQLRTSFEEDGIIDIYVDSGSKSVELSRHFAEELAVLADSFVNTETNKVCEIRLGDFSIYDSSLEMRDLARSLSYAKFPVVGMCFNMTPEGNFQRYLKSPEGREKIVQLLSLYFDRIAEELIDLDRTEIDE